MKGLIIINSFTSSPAISYKAWRLMSEFRLKGIECDVVKTVDLPVIYKNGIETIPDILHSQSKNAQGKSEDKVII